MSETFRPKSNFVWAGTSLILIVLFATNSVMVNTSTVQIIFEFVLGTILAIIAYLIWVKPKLVLRDDGIDVVNPLRREVIPYLDILELETKWALTIIHAKGKTRVWVAPANGKRKWIATQRFGWYGSTVPLSDSGDGGSQSMSESLDSSSGLAAYMIRERIKRLH